MCNFLCWKCNRKNVRNENEHLQTHYHPTKYVFLATAQLVAKDKNSNKINCRVLLDSGSQINLVTKNFAQKLRVPSRTVPVNITGIGKMTKSATKAITLSLESTQTNYSFRIDAIILKEITTFQPLIYVNTNRWQIPKKLKLADPRFNYPQKIDLLIGAEVYPHLMVNGQLSLGNSLPLLQNTKLGWIVLGKLLIMPEDFQQTQEIA